jgi:hypothetical protein
MDLLITDNYKQLNREKHLSSKSYGTQGHKHAGEVMGLMQNYGLKTVLDYGCGKATLKESFPPEMNGVVSCYDPCIDEHSGRPSPADLLVCTDVMEHIEPDCLGAVLADMASLTKQYAYLNISTVPANKHLSDGRNAHLIVESWRWWADVVREHFTLVTGEVNPIEFNVLCRNKSINLC